MEDQTTDGLVRALAKVARVLTLGGGAVIAHGHSRNTHDADVWVEPMIDATRWCESVQTVLAAFPKISVRRVALWQPIARGDFPLVVNEDGMVRISGLERPLDIFRQPNELDISSFDEVWQRASELKDGTRLPDTIDLLVTKQLTGRPKDQTDIFFLEQKAEAECLSRLPTASPEENCAMLNRFLTPNLAAAAARNADVGVRKLALGYLKELAAEGDPFAADLLRDL